VLADVGASHQTILHRLLPVSHGPTPASPQQTCDLSTFLSFFFLPFLPPLFLLLFSFPFSFSFSFPLSFILYLVSFPFRVSFPPYFFFFYLFLSIVIWKVHSKAGPLQSRQLQLTGSQTDGLSHAIAWPLIHNRRATVK